MGKSETPTGVKVIGVIDGDTLVLEGKSKVRLRFADAPELDLCGGKEAKELLEDLVVEKNVRIDEQIPDQYGRGMAMVYMGETSINKEMLTSGWVRYHHDSTDKTEVMKQAGTYAKEGKLGVYGKCQSKDVPDKPGCIIKGNIDKNSGKKTYYLPTCAQYNFAVVEKDIGEGWYCGEKDAIAAGYTKAKTCVD